MTQLTKVAVVICAATLCSVCSYDIAGCTMHDLAQQLWIMILTQSLGLTSGQHRRVDWCTTLQELSQLETLKQGPYASQ